MPESSRNHALWLGPLLALVGFASYFTLFARWPLTRDVPWLNLLLLAVALWATWIGVRRAWSRGPFTRILGGAALVWSLGLTALLIGYTWGLSYDLPSAEGGLAVGAPVPGLTLVDQNGASFDVAAASRKPLLLIFYRGHW